MTDHADILPVGKLPSGLLASLLLTFGVDDPDVLVGAGIGRDAAAIAIGGRILVAKTDPITFAGSNAAAYLVDVNANDLACLGATPRWLLVTALLAEGTTRGEVIALFQELNTISRAREIAVVGGHTEITAGLDRTMLVGLLLGDAAPATFLPPGGARAGDTLLITKSIAIEGTALLANELATALAGKLDAELLVTAQALARVPGLSVLADAAALRATPGITAMHDVTEGGLAMAAREITAAAGLGVELNRDAVPTHPATAAVAAALGLDPLGMLGSGSLLATADPATVGDLIASAATAGIAVTPVGRVLGPDAGAWLVHNEQRLPLPAFDTDEISRALAVARPAQDGATRG